MLQSRDSLTLTLHTPGFGRRNVNPYPLNPLPPSVCRPLAVDHCILGWEPEGLKGLLSGPSRS